MKISRKKFSIIARWILLPILFIGTGLFLVLKEKPRNVAIAETIPIRTKSMYIASAKGLRLREAPNLESKNKITIPYGELITILESDNKIEIINGVDTLCERKHNNSCFGIGGWVTINGISGRWVEVNWKDYTGYAFDGYLMNEDDFLLKRAIEERLSISLQPFNFEYSQIYRDHKFQFIIQKELANDKYRVITLTPDIDFRCNDYGSSCFNIVLDKDNNVLFNGGNYLGEVWKIKTNSITFYTSFQDETENVTIVYALKLSDWNIYEWRTSSSSQGEISEDYYLWSTKIKPTIEIIELF